MKTILATLCLFVASANALSLDALRNLITDELAKRESSDEITLGEYLSNTEPAAKYRELQRREGLEVGGCEAVCGHATIKLDTSQSCPSTKWRPNYVEKEGCECLTGYLCCSGVCPEVKLESCWLRDDSHKGLEYGTWTEDCCGCRAVKCVDCPTVDPKEDVCPSGNGSRPLDCYSYTAHHHFTSSASKCYEPHCSEDASDAPTDKICDKDCQKDSTQISHCLFDYNVCEGLSEKKDCVNVEKDPAALPLPEKCYNDPEEVVDDTAGHYYDAVKDSCEKCTKWTYEKLSCALEDALAAAEDCHQFGLNALDRTCFQKTTVKDECLCNVAECTTRETDIPDKFAPEHVCPMGHVKQEGVSICLKPRDICKPCKAANEIAASDCPNGKVVKTTDCNGCEIYECRRAQVSGNPCSCLVYKLDTEANTLTCDC
jgi:hypothetical protein